jgi:hypothetical protein
MNALPLGGVRFRWSDHLSALRWLGLLYRRPQQFEAILSTCSISQQLVTALWLQLHSAPYVLTISAASRLLAVSLIGLQFQSAPLALGIAGGLAFGLALGLALGIAGGLALGLALEIALGVAFGSCGLTLGIVLGIAFGITFGIPFGTYGLALVITFGMALGVAGGLAFGTDFGIVFGIPFAVFSTRVYYLLAHPLFVWPRLHGQWYRYHPIAWDDCCSIPFPGLDQLLVDHAEKVPDSGSAEIERLCSGYPSQRVMALRARVRLIAREAGVTKLGFIQF